MNLMKTATENAEAVKMVVTLYFNGGFWEIRDVDGKCYGEALAANARTVANLCAREAGTVVLDLGSRDTARASVSR